MWYEVNPEPTAVEGKALYLLDRFPDQGQEVMGFFLGEGIPFDNNQAERDLRMIKAKLKISGCFRSAEGTAAFADLRSVISTARKAGRSILDPLERMFDSPDQLAFELVPRIAGT